MKGEEILLGGEITDKDILELQGKTVVITQGAYRGELGVIADIEEYEGSIFYIVILQNGKERYFTKDFIEIVEDETENNEEEEKEIEEEIKAIEVESNEEATEEAGEGIKGWKKVTDKENYFEYKRKDGIGIYGFVKYCFEVDDIGWVIRIYDNTPFGAKDIVEPCKIKTKEEALKIASEWMKNHPYEN